VSPAAFSNGVTNAPLSTISTMLKMTTGGTTLIGFENCGLELLSHASSLVTAGLYPSCLAGAAEEYSPVVENAYAKAGLYKGEIPDWLPWCEKSSKGVPVSEGAAFFAIESCKQPAGNGRICAFTPIPDVSQIKEPFDLVLSGAGGGPQDVYELEALERISGSFFKPIPLLFTKPLLGECFALGSMLSAVIACDILVNATMYPSFPIHRKLSRFKQEYLPRDVRSILVIGASRNGQISSGLFQKEIS
jgi:3-oxoacyl-(acyl-carrier-protein) synthase